MITASRHRGLRARLDIDEVAALADPDLLRTLVHGFGAPLNVVFPDQLDRNIARAQHHLQNQSIQSRLYLAHKANRSRGLLRAAAETPAFLDVASEGELVNGLAAGFAGLRMEATGPKNQDFVRLCLQHQVLINVDSFDELSMIETLSQSRDQVADVVIRVSGFDGLDGPNASRFGVPLSQADALLQQITDSRSLRCRGFAFHFTATTGPRRARAIEQLLPLYAALGAMGHPADVINVGGGFGAPLLADERDWERFNEALRHAQNGTGAAVTWRNEGYPAAARTDPARSATFETEIDALLAEPLSSQGNRRTADVLNDNGIALHLEPGRALFAHCGLTVTEVTAVKTGPDGSTVAVLDMNRSNLDTTEREYFADPVLVDEESNERTAPVFLAGNTCSPADMVVRHVCHLARAPRRGDLLAFPNTAAYFMDFSEANVLQQRTAPKVAVTGDVDNHRWCLDERYRGAA